MRSHELPKELIANTETKSVSLTPEVASAIPDVERAFAAVDLAYTLDPETYLRQLQTSVVEFKSSEGADVSCSILFSSDTKEDEVLVVFAPFSDGAPKTSAEQLYGYLAADKGSLFAKEKAAPNSWNQLTKSATTFELLKALGRGVPVLTVFSPIPPGAYSPDERRSIRAGDFAPAARITQEAIMAAQSWLHGADSETQINTVHLQGASLGASNAVTAGSVLPVRTVTAQELIMGPIGVPDLFKRFTVSPHVGEPSDEEVSERYPMIEEVALRRAIDKHGSELIGTNARMVKGMRPTYMAGLTRPNRVGLEIYGLLSNNVDLAIALAENSSLTHQTKATNPYRRDWGKYFINIRAQKGQKLGHLVDEHVALTSLITALNITTTPE